MTITAVFKKGEDICYQDIADLHPQAKILVEYNKLQSDNAILLEALEKYGAHLIDCAKAVNGRHECTCGLNEAIKKVKGE